MATNWSKLARDFLGKVKPGDSDSSQGSSESASTTSTSSGSQSAGGSPNSTTGIDIGRQQVGGVYAKALLGAAGKNAGSVLDELSGLTKLVGDTPAFRDILDSPRVSASEKIGILDRTLKGRVSPVLLNFLKVVSEHERLDCLPYIQREMRRMHNDEQGVVQVVVTTAETMSSGEFSRVRSDLEKKLGAKVDIEATVDPRIIGGIVVRMGDQVYDGSVSQRLTSMRESAVEKAVEKMRSATDTYAVGSEATSN